MTDDVRRTRVDAILERGEATEEELRELEAAGLISVSDAVSDAAPGEGPINVDDAIRAFADAAADPRLRAGLLLLLDGSEADKDRFIAEDRVTLPEDTLTDCEIHIIIERLCGPVCRTVCKVVTSRLPGGKVVEKMVCTPVCREVCKDVTRRVCKDPQS